MPFHVNSRLVLAVACLILVLFGVRTALRGSDYKSQFILAQHDIASSQDDYIAYNDVAIYYYDHEDYAKAEPAAIKSVSIYPYATNELTLGGVFGVTSNYAGAYTALTNGLKYMQYQPIYDDLAIILLYYGNSSSDKQFLINGLKYFPTDANLWFHLAILDEESNDNEDAKVAITNAANYGQDNQTLYNDIMTDRSFTLYVGQNKTIRIK